jgi:acetate kinase
MPSGVRHSKAVDTSVGFLLMAGLVMSTCLADKHPELLYLLASAGKMNDKSETK